MTELEALLLKKLSEFSSYQKQQSDALQALVEMQSSRLDDLSMQVLRLSEQLNSLSDSKEA